MKLSLATAALVTQRITTAALASSSFLRDTTGRDDSIPTLNTADSDEKNKSAFSDAKRRKLQRIQHLKAKRKHHSDSTEPASGRLKNQTRSSNHEKVACNPKADVGVLACGSLSTTEQLQYRCLANGVSPLGGYCVNTEEEHAQLLIQQQNQQATMPSSNWEAMTGGLLWKYQLPQLSNRTVECDPDVGILACNSTITKNSTNSMGTTMSNKHQCVKDSRSALGGFCMDTAVTISTIPNRGRRLTSQEQRLSTKDINVICKPAKEDANYGFDSSCDCSGVDLDTGGGTITCTATNLCLEALECPDTCIDATLRTTLSNFKLDSIELCTELQAADENLPERGCMTKIYGSDANATSDDSCTAVYNDEDCDCTLVPSGLDAISTEPDVDCSAVGGGIGDSVLPSVSECGPSSTTMPSMTSPSSESVDEFVGIVYCLLYGCYSEAVWYNENIVDVPGFGELTCRSLAYTYGHYYRPGNECDTLQAVLTSECCPPARTLAPSCPFPCGGDEKYRLGVGEKRYHIVTLPDSGDESFCEEAYWEYYETCRELPSSLHSECCEPVHYDYDCDLCGRMNTLVKDERTVYVSELDGGTTFDCRTLFSDVESGIVGSDKDSCDSIRSVFQPVCCEALPPGSAYPYCTNPCHFYWDESLHLAEGKMDKIVTLPAHGEFTCFEIYYDQRNAIIDDWLSCHTVTVKMRAECCEPGPPRIDYVDKETKPSCSLSCNTDDGPQAMFEEKSIDIPGHGEELCQYLGHGYRYHGIEDNCETLDALLQSECCTPECPFCPEDYYLIQSKTFVNIPGLGERGCGYLQYDGHTEETCTLIQDSLASAVAECCYYRCDNLCGDGYQLPAWYSKRDSITHPSVGEVSCHDIEELEYELQFSRGEVQISQAECQDLRPLVQSTCCEPRQP